MQHRSKWPFHTEKWKKNQSSTSFSFFNLHYYSLHTYIPLAAFAACTYVYTIYTKQNAACQINWPQHQKAISSWPTCLILLFTSMLYFSPCLFVFASHLCPLPRRLASSATGHPSHVKSQKQRQVMKTGPDFSAHQLRCRARSHHNG